MDSTNTLNERWLVQDITIPRASRNTFTIVCYPSNRGNGGTHSGSLNC